jgi:hypothetical protein
MCTRMATSKISRPLLGVHRKRTRVQLLQPCRVTRLPRLRSHWLHLNIAVRRNYSSPGRTCSTSTSPCAATTRHLVARALRQPCRAPRLLVIRIAPAQPRVRAPRHVARHVTRLVVDYSGSHGLVVDYFASAARPGASARRAARHAARRAARRRLLRLAPARPRLLRLRRASGCLGTSRGSSYDSSRRSASTTPPRAGSSSTTSPPPRVRVPRHVTRLVIRLVAPLVVDYFASATRPGASARHAARHTARHAARRRLLRLAQARRRLLRLHRAARCLGTSRGSSRHSSSTTSPTSRIRVPRHVARPVTGFVVDYSVRRNFLLRPHWLYFSHVVRRDYLSRGNTGSTSSTPPRRRLPVASRRPFILTSFPN